ncbi:MAG TPA: hypothetical protein VKB80_04610 [Kofleriaceae bacterium]|nr:hypothetical protein [Kofleriaceae bacterium]
MDRPETAHALATGAGSGSDVGQGPDPGAGADRGGSLASGSAELRVEAAVILPSAGRTARYGMFEAVSVTPDGATLRGGLLLEVNEEVTLELRLPDLSAFRAEARVVEIVHGDRPAMKVIWTAVAEADRRRLRR